jgi:membrane-associated protease RseP (regulator of RpoE activity)
MNYHIALLVFIIYWLIVILLDRVKILERYDISAYGPILMIRTRRLQTVVDRLSVYKKFWRIYATIVIPFILLAMFGMFFLILLSLPNIPREPSVFTEPRNILFIPGINVFIPFTYGWIGLFVALAVHEFSHAILCGVEKIRIKSMGLLLALIPLGGFTEPDEEELEGSGHLERIRMFSAGNMGNFVIAFIAFILLMLVVGSIVPISEGVIVHSVSDDWAGVKPGMIITSINGNEIPSVLDLEEEMRDIEPGEKVDLGIIAKENGETRRFDVSGNVSDEDEEWIQGIGVYLYKPKGIGGIKTYVYEPTVLLRHLPAVFIEHPIETILLAIVFPILIFSGFYSPLTDAYIVSFPAIFCIANVFLWILWINFYLGLFNSLPAIPFDGGLILREMLRSLIEKFTPDKKIQERVSNGIAALLATIVFGSIVLIIILPYVL